MSFWTYLPEIHILSFECLINASGMYSLLPVPATVESILADHINLFPFKIVVRGFFLVPFICLNSTWRSKKVNGMHMEPRNRTKFEPEIRKDFRSQKL